MSSKHIFQSPEGLVTKSLRGVISYNRSLRLDETHRVIFDASHRSHHVSIVGGGGSGHEPAWSGFVGENLLAASVSGDIFASPSTKQIMAAIRAVPSESGTILVFGNYTGDCLHFGMALEKAVAMGHKCRMIIFGDDVSVGRTGRVGRRGLPGQMLALKAMGALAGAGGTLDHVYQLGTALADQMVSVAVTLDHCHVPGRSGNHENLPDDVIEIGTGPHNEPGHRRISPIPSAEDLVKQALAYCLDSSDPERGYIKVSGEDDLALLINNFGGFSVLELGALVDEVLTQLRNGWGLTPKRVYHGSLESSLNAPGFSLSVLNITAASKSCGSSVKEINAFLDTRTNTAWESVAGSQSQDVQAENQLVRISPVQDKAEIEKPAVFQVNPKLVDATLRAACLAIIEVEPNLTTWDTVMGDGDCGYTFCAGASGVLKALDNGRIDRRQCMTRILSTIADIIETEMGGTLGGILGIFFAALSNAMRDDRRSAETRDPTAIWSLALQTALDHLCRYTTAREGDRTIMDVLIPFVRGMREGGFALAVQYAVRGAHRTKSLEAKLGRASYVGTTVLNGGDTERAEFPDPGAWGMMVAVASMESCLIT